MRRILFTLQCMAGANRHHPYRGQGRHKLSSAFVAYFVNGCDRSVVAIRIWSGPLSIQDIKTPSPENKPFRLINLPFYYVGQLDKVIAKF